MTDNINETPITESIDKDQPVGMPDHPASVWRDGKWEKVYAIIMENGTLRTDPDSICPQCVLLLTFDEWDKFPKPRIPQEIWDFKLEKWVDPRSFELVQKEALLRIRNVLEAVRWRLWGTYIESFEIATWGFQVEEANAYLANPNNRTPGIDAYLSILGKEGPTKVELCNKILDNHERFKVVSMQVNGYQKLWLNALYRCETVDAITDLMFELAAYDLEQRKAIAGNK